MIGQLMDDSHHSGDASSSLYMVQIFCNIDVGTMWHQNNKNKKLTLRLGLTLEWQLRTTSTNNNYLCELPFKAVIVIITCKMEMTSGEKTNDLFYRGTFFDFLIVRFRFHFWCLVTFCHHCPTNYKTKATKPKTVVLHLSSSPKKSAFIGTTMASVRVKRSSSSCRKPPLSVVLLQQS